MGIIITCEAADGARGQLENPGPPSNSDIRSLRSRVI